MKNIFFLISILFLFSCKKENESQKRYFRYVFHCNHLTGNARMNATKYGNPPTDFWDTVTVTNYEKDFTEDILNTDFPMPITMTASLLNDLNMSDSVFLELYCDGVKQVGSPNVMMDCHHSDYTFTIQAK